MIFEEKEYVLKNGLKIILKTPEIKDAKMLLNNIITCTKESEYLLSTERDFQKYIDDITLEEKFIEGFKNNKNCLIAVYSNNIIIGNCVINFKNSVKNSHRASVGIAIQKDYWGMGIGSILFDELIGIAKATPGVEQIELDVVKNNERAKKLYEKKGFVKTGDIPRQLKLNDGRYLDGESMVLFL